MKNIFLALDPINCFILNLKVNVCKLKGSIFVSFFFGSVPSADSRRAVVSYWRKYVHEVLVNRLGGLSLPR